MLLMLYDMILLLMSHLKHRLSLLSSVVVDAAVVVVVDDDDDARR